MKLMSSISQRWRPSCLAGAVFVALSSGATCLGAEIPADWAAPPHSRQGWSWPDFASEASLSFDQVIQRLSATENKTTMTGRALPAFWEGQMRSLLPEQAGWIGVRGNGELLMWRAADGETVKLEFETLRGLRATSFDTRQFGVIIRDSQLSVALLERKTAQVGSGAVASGSTLKLINLSNGSIMAERSVESEARLVASPSGRRLLLLLPVAPMEGRLMSETSGSPPLDDDARRNASSAVRLISADAIDQEKPFTAHIGAGCTDAGFSPRETMAWTRGSNDCTRVFRVSDQRRVGPVFRLPKEAVVTVTDDGRLVVGLFGELRVYDVVTGEMLAMQPMAHAREIVAIAVPSNGKSVATFGRDGTVRLWNLADLALAAEWDAPEADADGRLGFIDDETIVVAAREYGSSRPRPTCVLSWKDLTELRRWNTVASGAVFRLVAVSPQGGYVAVADSAKNVGFYDNTSGKLLAFRRSPIREIFSLYAPLEKPLAIAGSYEGASAYVAADDSFITSELPELAAKPMKRWSSVSTETPFGRFISSENLDWFGTLAGRAVRAGQAGFPRGMAQPQGWIAIQGSELVAAIGWDVILLYEPKTQRVVHVYRLLSRAVHAAYDPTSRTLLVIHGDGVLRRWPVPCTPDLGQDSGAE